MSAPVAVFVYNRPLHTKKTIEALSKNIGAKDTDVFIFSDYAKNEASLDKVCAVREYIKSEAISNYFKSLNIIYAENNLGLANSIINGVTDLINRYNRVIVLEDDLVTSTDFLSYMNEALDYYELDEKIWSISGYTFELNFPEEYKSDVYLAYRGCSWGWATWKDRWEKVDWEVSDYNTFKKDRKLRNEFNRGGRDLSFMLDKQMEGKKDSWAIRWCYSQFKFDQLTVYPRVSRVKNIGLDGSGTHSKSTKKYSVNLEGELKRVHLDNPDLNFTILKQFKNYYGSALLYLLISAKKKIEKRFNYIKQECSKYIK